MSLHIFAGCFSCRAGSLYSAGASPIPIFDCHAFVATTDNHHHQPLFSLKL
jgi:hypothetical protein